MSTGPEQTSSKLVVPVPSARWSTTPAPGACPGPRWSNGLKVVLVALAIPVALALAVAVSTCRTTPTTATTTRSAPRCGWASSGSALLSAVVAKLDGERDTPAGREAAARWLGMRELLGEDPLFGEQPPAAVAIWDRILAHGTALGTAHGVVRALPLGAENDRQAWSSVGGRWRVVRVRYPRAIPPGYGRPPAVALLFGIAHLVVGIPLLPLACRSPTPCASR